MAKVSGTVKWFNDAKGFGFLTCSDGRDVFVHFSGVVGDPNERRRTLKEGEPVEFEVEDSPKGPRAVKVTRLVKEY